MFTKLLVLASLTLTAHAASLEEIRQQFELPGLTAGSRKNGITELQTTGVRKLGDSTPANTDDLWHLGSNGKAITATLGAVLVEKGFLNWNTTLAEVFPKWKIHDHYNSITLKELFAHRSGVHYDITAFGGGALWAKFLDPKTDQQAIREEFTKAVLEAPPETDGSKFRYSNSGYIVAGSIFTQLTGKTWEELVTTNIFRPLGMNTCHFGAAGSESPNSPTQPWPHEELFGKLTPISPALPESDNPKALGPAGTIHCSMQDWLKFAQAHLDGFRGQNTPILSAKGFEPLHQDYKGQGYTSGGLIFEKRDGKVYLGHNGSNTMNFAILVMDTSSNAAYVAATNRGLRKGEQGAQAAMLSLGSPDVCIQKTCLLKK